MVNKRNNPRKPASRLALTARESIRGAIRMVRKDIQEIITKLKGHKPEELLKIGIKAYENATELVDEALLLVGQHSYARGFFLSFTAFEELGKAYYLCLLGYQLLGGASKDALTDWYKTTASLFRFHPEKIRAAGITRLFIDYLEKRYLKTVTNADEVLKKDIDELDKEDFPSIVQHTQALVEPMVKWFTEQLTQPSDVDGEEVVTTDLRNRSLYVDVLTEVDGMEIETPEDIPRDFTLYFLATTIKYVDFMYNHFRTST